MNIVNLALDDNPQSSVLVVILQVGFPDCGCIIIALETLRVQEAWPEKFITFLLLKARGDHIELVKSLEDAGEAGDNLALGEQCLVLHLQQQQADDQLRQQRPDDVLLQHEAHHQEVPLAGGGDVGGGGQELQRVAAQQLQVLPQQRQQALRPALQLALPGFRAGGEELGYQQSLEL